MLDGRTMTTPKSHEIELIDDGQQGAFLIRNEPGVEPELLAEMAWRWAGAVMVITHTGVRSPLRHQGIAGKLVDRAASLARERGFQIWPQCPFAAKAFADSPQRYADVRAAARP